MSMPALQTKSGSCPFIGFSSILAEGACESKCFQLYVIVRYILPGGFKYFLFPPLFGEDSHFDYYFSKGLKPPTSIRYVFFWHGASVPQFDGGDFK